MLPLRSRVLPWSINVLFGCHFLKTSVLCSKQSVNVNQVKRSYTPVNLSYSVYEPEEHKLIEGAPPILILHGLLGSKANWLSLSFVIAEYTRRRVYALDARNHGESPHTNEFTYNHMIADTYEFMKTMKIKNATLIGHSMGGRTSMLFSLLYPELVDSMVIVDISPKGMSSGFNDIPGYLEAMMDIDLTASSLGELRREVRAELEDVIDRPEIVAFLLTNLIENPPKNYKWKLNLKGIYDNIKEIGKFDCDSGKVYNGPTLFIGGSLSDYISEDSKKVIKKLFPASEVKYVINASHWVHSEKPKEFLDMALGFLLKKKNFQLGEKVKYF